MIIQLILNGKRNKEHVPQREKQDTTEPMLASPFQMDLLKGIKEQQSSRPRWDAMWTNQELWSRNSSLGTTDDEQYIEVARIP